jgi:predicted molibdopterin-dependent oxidoreductase YjgC
MRVTKHPILGNLDENPKIVNISVDDKIIPAIEGEPVASALMASGIRVMRTTPKYHHPRGIFCAIGRCTDCAMTIDGVPNVRTCVTKVRDGMKLETQEGLGKWGDKK